MKAFLTFVCCFFTVAFSLPAQTLLEGYVRDMECCGISEAVVTVMRPDTREVIYSTQTDTAGVFVLADVPRHFLLDVASFGYKPYTCALDADSCKGNPLYVTLEYISLDEVTVTADGKPRMVRSGNKVLIDKLGNSPHAQGSDMYTFMKFIPVLNVPVSGGEVSVRENGNANAVLLVNGKLVHIPMVDYLKNVHVENIERIEVVAHPMGEYKVDGDVAVINLVVKRREDEGARFNLSLQDDQSNVNSQRGTFSISYTRNKTYISSGVYINNNLWKREKFTDYQYTDADRRTLSESDTKTHNTNFSGYFNLDYELDQRHTVGMQLAVEGRRTENSFTDFSTYYGDCALQRTDSAYLSRSEAYNPNKFSYMSANLNYTFKIDGKGSTFFADVDYRMTRPEVFTHSVYEKTDGDQTLLHDTDILQQDRTHIDTYGIWLRYIHVFAPATRLVSGLSYYASATRYNYGYGILTDGGGYVNDTGRSNCFYFDDYTFSAYTTLHHAWTERLNMSLGLAVHVYGADGEQKTTGERISRDEVNLLPSLNLSYKPNPKHYLSLDFSTRISRPGYFSLNPFRTYSSATVYRQGNPSLKSAQTYRGGINYTFLQAYSMRTFFSYSKDLQADLSLPDSEGWMATMPVNRGKSWNINCILDCSKTLFNNYLTLFAMLDAGYVTYINGLSGMESRQHSIHGMGVMDFNVTLSKKHNLSLGASYGFSTSSINESNSQPARHSLDFNLMKRFEHSNLRVGVHRFFRKNDKDVYYEQPGFGYYTFSKQYWNVEASYSVTFGNSRTRSVSSRSNSEVISRMANE